MFRIILSLLCLLSCQTAVDGESNPTTGLPAIEAEKTAPSRSLLLAKENTGSIRNGEAALAALIKEADKALKATIVPVTEKTILAASGDKHDYVSMGPYWWPDPSKPDGLPYIRRDGERNPEIYELDRYKMDDLIKSVVTLGYAYFFTGKEEYAQKAVQNLRMWFIDKDTRMNPNLNYAQMVPGHDNGKGRCFGIIDVYGMVEMVDCMQLLSPSKAMTDADRAGLKQWFSDFLNWLLTSENGLEEYNTLNNHATAYDVQVTAYALFTGKDEIAQRFINDFPGKRIFKQIEPDGSQPLELERTIAFHYTLFNIDHMMDMAALSRSMGRDLYGATSEDGRSIHKAIEFIKPYLGKPQSAFPYQQIKEWNENQEKLCWVLRRASLFEENTEFDSLFDTHCKTGEKDRNWLIFAKQD